MTTKFIFIIIGFTLLSSCQDNYNYNWDERVRIPDSFSPDGDGCNDIWCINADDVTKCLLIVTDQDGIEVWRTTNVYTCWNPESSICGGIYYYYFHAEFTDGLQHDYSGEIYLLH
jgi:hypothetical protein